MANKVPVIPPTRLRRGRRRRLRMGGPRPGVAVPYPTSRPGCSSPDGLGWPLFLHSHGHNARVADGLIPQSALCFSVSRL